MKSQQPIKRIETLHDRVVKAKMSAPLLSERYHELEDREKRLTEFKRYVKMREKFGGR